MSRPLPQPFFDAFAKEVIEMLRRKNQTKEPLDSTFSIDPMRRGDDAEGMSRPKLDRNR